MLLNNGTWFGRLKPTGAMGVIPASLKLNDRLSFLRQNAQWVGQDVSIPNGYQSVARAFTPSFKTSSKMAMYIQGSGDISFSVYGIGTLGATLIGVGSTVLNAQMGASIYTTLQGSGNVSVDARGIGTMTVNIDAGSRPSAFDIAQEVWQSQKTAYNSAGTMGNALNNASTGGVDYAALGLAVWDVLTVDMDLAGSAGEKLKTLLTKGQFIALKD
jgi:hypothetical protein